MSNNAFSAAASALGYLYQCRLALVCALRRVRKNAEFQLAIETLDKVVFEKNGEPSVLLQAKHLRERSNLAKKRWIAKSCLGIRFYHGMSYSFANVGM